MRGLYQRGVGFAPLARRQTGKPVGSDRHAYQAQGRMTHGRGHAPYLAVAALGEDDFDPGGRDVLAKADRGHARPQLRLRNETDFRRERVSIIEPHAAAQCVQRLRARHIFDLRPIGFGQLVFRFGNAGLQGTVVREQQQAFAVVVEPSCCAHLRYRNVFGERASAFLVGELAQDIEWFVDQDEHYSRSVSSCA